MANEEKKSLLYKLKPFTDRLPAITKPEGHVHFRTKMLWVILIIFLYFVMTNVYIYGLDRATTIDLFAQYRAIIAGASGSILQLGIGPIVTGSIVMQLFTGAKIINLDLTDDEDKAVYQSTQKFVVLIMIFVEAIPQVFGYLSPSPTFVHNIGAAASRISVLGVYPLLDSGKSLSQIIIIGQLFVGSYLIFLMDEIVSKWGIGSGISMFIAAGVSQQIFTGALNWYPAPAASNGIVATGPFASAPVGTIPKIIYVLFNVPAGQLSSSGFETLMLGQPNPVTALIGTIAIFLIVAWTESTRIELPLAHETAKGARGRYPIKLIYASNIPVILVAALLANVSMFSYLLWTNPAMMKIPLIGHQAWLGTYAAGSTTPTGGIAWYVSNVNGLSDWLLPMISPVYANGSPQLEGHTFIQFAAWIGAFTLVYVLGSILFAKFWIETTNMGPQAVAEQIESSGMQIPGFRRDPRVMKRVLERYIPTVTVLSGALVGFLAVGADLIGTVGNATGVGLLLTTGILIQFYDAIGQEQMMEMHPVLRQFFGG
ncbi:MAG: preprotein translocase subunit SecY [Candidatus Thermoplasmatota archaeon]|nr:preprotein translocase subunit SecY [Candidatus Sysuiplasma jiujiangense]MCL4317979.1 preprotein translocase subunit SecY [Candidatus Thermoplasmatota archaeon]MCL5253058.1 preprotein translocase subunit SecY [Candidatus Thermoplasmatota archaeon]